MPVILPTAEAPQKAGVANRLDINIGRLSEIAERVEGICDHIYGPTPTGVGEEKPRPIASLQLKLDDEARLIDRIFSGIERIQSAL